MSPHLDGIPPLFAEYHQDRFIHCSPGLKGGMSHLQFTLGLLSALFSRRLDTVMTRKRVREDEGSLSNGSKVHKRMRKNVEPLPDVCLRRPERHKTSFISSGVLVFIVGGRRLHVLVWRKKHQAKSIFVPGGVPSVGIYPCAILASMSTIQLL